MNGSSLFMQAVLVQQQSDATTKVVLVQAGPWTAELQRDLFPPKSFRGH